MILALPKGVGRDRRKEGAIVTHIEVWLEAWRGEVKVDTDKR
jgi:hypothetical protein